MIIGKYYIVKSGGLTVGFLQKPADKAAATAGPSKSEPSYGGVASFEGIRVHAVNVLREGRVLVEERLSCAAVVQVGRESLR